MCDMAEEEFVEYLRWLEAPKATSVSALPAQRTSARPGLERMTPTPISAEA